MQENCPTTSDVLKELASHPKKVETAEGRVEEHSIKDVVDGLAAAEAQQKNKKSPWGMAVARVVPKGGYG